MVKTDLKDFTTEELLICRDYFLVKPSFKSLKLAETFIKACGCYAKARPFCVSDDDLNSENIIISGSGENAKEISVAEVAMNALKRWEPEKASFKTFFHKILLTSTIVPRSMTRYLDDWENKIRKELKQLLRSRNQFGEESDIREVISRNEGILHDVVRKLYSDCHDESFIERKVKDFSSDFFGSFTQQLPASSSGNASYSDKESFERMFNESIWTSVSSCQEGEQTDWYLVMQAIFDRLVESERFNPEDLDCIAMSNVVDSLNKMEKCEYTGFILEKAGYCQFVERVRRLLLDFLRDNGRLPMEQEIAAMYNLKKNTFSKRKSSFTEAARKLIDGVRNPVEYLLNGKNEDER